MSCNQLFHIHLSFYYHSQVFTPSLHHNWPLNANNDPAVTKSKVISQFTYYLPQLISLLEKFIYFASKTAHFTNLPPTFLITYSQSLRLALFHFRLLHEGRVQHTILGPFCLCNLRLLLGAFLGGCLINFYPLHNVSPGICICMSHYLSLPLEYLKADLNINVTKTELIISSSQTLFPAINTSFPTGFFPHS